ncbi:MAG: hypothetical protein WCP03_02915, partial [Candidatus Saccharibacteria bacterium]
TAEGEYRLTVTDMAGNVTISFFTIDETLPVISLTGTMGQPGYYRSSVGITITEVNPYTNILERWNGSAWVGITYTDPVTAEGEYRLTVTDMAGNVTTVHFVIDKTAPVVSGITNGTYYNHNVTISFSDLYLAGATLNGKLFTSGSIVSSEGSYTLVVTDLAGNVTTVHFVIYKTAPTNSTSQSSPTYTSIQGTENSGSNSSKGLNKAKLKVAISKSSNKWPLIILILVILATIAAGAWIIYRNKNQKAEVI